MPLYEYLCADCGERSEILQRHGDPPLTVCPNCGGALKKLVSAPAFQFKGKGWYVTDYARSGASGGDDASAGKGALREGAKREAGKGEAGAAATSESPAPSESATKSAGTAKGAGAKAPAAPPAPAPTKPKSSD